MNNDLTTASSTLAKKYFSNLDLFKKIQRNLYDYDGKYLVNMSNESCSCIYYLKWNICAHILALRMKKDKFVFKAKRGRIPNASKALNK